MHSSRSGKNASRGSAALRVLYFSLFISLVFVLITLFSPVKKALVCSKRINILLMGISETDYAKFAEVIKIISYEPVTGFLDIVSVPRDTMIPVSTDITWKGIQKLDEIYSRLEREYGADTTVLSGEFRDVLEKFLDNYLEINYYIQVDYRSFVDFIDKLGGVEIDVQRRMQYTDKAQNLHIDISTGVQKMNGEQALKYVRFRDKIMGDIERQDRQHKFLKQVLQKVKSPSIIPKVPVLIKAVADNVDTNLSFADILVLADEIRNIDLDNFRIQKIPGKPVTKWGKSYWEVDEMAVREVLDVVRNSQLVNLPELKIDVNSRLSDTITAEVWNATDTGNMARDLTDYLRKRNVDVVRYGNFGAYKKYTQIISRNGDLASAREVSRIIGCRNIKTELDTSRMVDINIVIGHDFRPPWKKQIIDQ
ncbi:MAG: LCP family protein [Elusimicrobia bacterium]|nr:LCP family protein [Elusimicrobiota bacterium]